MKQITRQEIKQIVLSSCSRESVVCARVLLYGSRGRNDHDRFSDYDIMIITADTLPREVKNRIAKQVRSELAVKLIGADILVVSEDDFQYLKDKTGSTIKTASTEGVIL